MTDGGSESERDELRADLEATQKNRDAVHEWNKKQAETIRELDATVQRLTREKEAMQEGLERVRDMAERPVCICGRLTGTAALKLCAARALDAAQAAEREDAQ
jgi:hypothetical protein